jgi:plasmid stability protein
MPTLTIRNVPAEDVARLKARAKADNRPLEAELREILPEQAAAPACALDHPIDDGLHVACAARFGAPLIGDDRRLLQRLETRSPRIAACRPDQIESLLDEGGRA